MVSTNDDHQLEALAEEVFELNKLSWTARAQVRRRSESFVSEYEFLALDVLIKQGPMTVGELQKHVGVMPAQMSRVIRSLENKPDGPMIRCAIWFLRSASRESWIALTRCRRSSNTKTMKVIMPYWRAFHPRGGADRVLLDSSMEGIVAEVKGRGKAAQLWSKPI